MDPCRATLPPGAEELVRVSWLPSRASAGPYCGVMHAVLNDGVGGSAAALKVRLRAPPVPQISGATGNDDDVHRRRASTASSVGSHVSARRASVTAYGARRASALQPLSGNAPRRRFRASLDESAPDLASPGFKRSRADCDVLLPSVTGLPSFGNDVELGGNSVVPSGVLSFTASEQSAQRRRKLPKIAAVGKTLRLRAWGAARRLRAPAWTTATDRTLRRFTPSSGCASRRWRSRTGSTRRSCRTRTRTARRARTAEPGASRPRRRGRDCGRSTRGTRRFGR